MRIICRINGEAVNPNKLIINLIHDRVASLVQQVENFANAEKDQQQTVYDKKHNKNVCLNPATYICN